MLSSGTLNLKFMQRNNNNQSQNLKPKIESNSSLNYKTTTHSEQLTTRNSQDHLTKGKRKLNDLGSSSIDLDPNPAPTWTITYEDSLISFPFLYSNSSCSALYSSLNTILPVHLGQKSFGHSKKSTEKLTEPADSSKHSKSDSSTAPKPTNVSKKLKKDHQSSSKSSHQEQSQTQVQSRSKYDGGIVSTIDQDQKSNSEKKTTQDQKSQSGFKKPFDSTFIKSKNKLKKDLSISSADQSHSKDNLQSCTFSKPLKITKSKKTDDTVTINADDENNHSDDAELVNHQIEMMFKEARKAQHTTQD